ncbi:MAG: hypothetical protein JSU61_10675 [Fidelibacterota bacterium]|nr:MAG: hypothetical protein JSU61_10675 [Candidatus Neomarinimicrobiota bacterium]
MNREAIIQQFPWLKELDRPMIISNDLDGLLAAAFLHHHLGWRIAGYYNCTTLWLSPIALEDKADLIWIDLDICQPAYPAVGHHILTLTHETPEPLRHICNPNLLAGIGAHTFSSKYPFSTILFLLWLHEIDVRRNLLARLLILHADSVWINLQHYYENAHQWQQRLSEYNWKWLFNQVDTEQFECRIQDHLLPRLERLGGMQSTGGNLSRHLRLQGSQLRFNPDWEEDIALGLWDLVGTYLKWSPPTAPGIEHRIEGRRQTAALPSVTDENFPDNLIQDRIFSYAITSRDRINFTHLDW